MRDIAELEKNALKFWSKEIAALESEASVIPRLVDTQEDFIALLVTANKNPFAWKDALKTTNMSANLFLKHLMVLSDIGGEKTQRACKELQYIVGPELQFSWSDNIFKYEFKTIGGSPWTNTNLKVDGKNIVEGKELTPMMEDVINFILFAGSTLSEKMPQEYLEKCILGTLIGRKTELDKFVKERYIWVSRITGGASSNTLGNIAQQYIVKFLKEHLPNWDFSKKTIPNISANERTDISFDIVSHSPTGKYVAIEASFQVTTNSVIERKAGQARARFDLLHSNGHYVAYVIDGSGNFSRTSALKAICTYSDCTVTYHEKELMLLVKFLKSLEKK